MSECRRTLRDFFSYYENKPTLNYQKRLYTTRGKKRLGILLYF